MLNQCLEVRGRLAQEGSIFIDRVTALRKGLGRAEWSFLPCKDMTFLSTGLSDHVPSWKENEPLQTLSLLAL